MEISDRQLELVDQLVASGLYGENRTKTLRTLMIRGLEDAIRLGTAKLRPFTRDPNQLELEMVT